MSLSVALFIGVILTPLPNFIGTISMSRPYQLESITNFLYCFLSTITNHFPSCLSICYHLTMAAQKDVVLLENFFPYH